MIDVETVVVGAGMAGLAAAWHLRAAGERFAVVEAGGRPGEVWRQRYDSLRLFTPARFCALPGRPMPLAPGIHPGKDDMADYLSAYAEEFALPVRTGLTIRSHAVDNGRHRLTGDDGTAITADRLIVATGALQLPALPSFAGDLDPEIRQLHSSQYHRPDDLPAGRVLVVGAGTAGGDIAMELAGSHEVWLAGPSTGSVPVALARSRTARRLIFGLRIPPGRLGRLIHDRPRRAAPLVWQSPASLRKAGIQRLPRVRGLRGGEPVLTDGRVLEVSSVVWCTGLRPGFGWLDSQAIGPHGWPLHQRGVSTTIPGLGYVGLPLQNTFASGFLSGMPEDASYVVDALHRSPAR